MELGVGCGIHFPVRNVFAVRDPGHDARQRWRAGSGGTG